MNRSIPDGFISEFFSRSSRSACHSCCRRRDCPYSCDRILEGSLHDAASQGEAAAQLLTAEASRLLTEIANADSVSRLLHADEHVERTLSSLFHGEIAVLERLSASR